MRNVSSYALSKYTKKTSLQIGYKIVIYESTSDLWDYTTLRHSAVQPCVDIVEYAMCNYLYRYLMLCMLIDIVINVE